MKNINDSYEEEIVEGIIKQISSKLSRFHQILQIIFIVSLKSNFIKWDIIYKFIKQYM